jgi:alpha-methylacyl-CoA racemase
MLDGGATFYDTYQTKDGRYMAVYSPNQEIHLMNSGAIEPQFYAALLKGLSLRAGDVPSRDDREKWSELRDMFTKKFLEKTQEEWETVFDGTDSCVTPLVPLTPEDNRPIAHLSVSPSLPIEDPKVEMLQAGTGTEDVLREWIGWHSGRDYQIDAMGSVTTTPPKL